MLFFRGKRGKSFLAAGFLEERDKDVFLAWKNLEGEPFDFRLIERKKGFRLLLEVIDLVQFLFRFLLFLQQILDDQGGFCHESGDCFPLPG